MRQLMMRTDDDAGFTLIELLIVIVVIGVLAGIAILAFDPFQDSAGQACRDAQDRIEGTLDAAEGIDGFDEGAAIAQDADCPAES